MRCMLHGVFVPKFFACLFIDNLLPVIALHFTCRGIRIRIRAGIEHNGDGARGRQMLGNAFSSRSSRSKRRRRCRSGGEIAQRGFSRKFVKVSSRRRACHRLPFLNLQLLLWDCWRRRVTVVSFDGRLINTLGTWTGIHRWWFERWSSVGIGRRWR